MILLSTELGMQEQIVSDCAIMDDVLCSMLWH
jgi:hypothetical protein